MRGPHIRKTAASPRPLYLSLAGGAVYPRATAAPRIPRGIESHLSIIARYIPTANAIAKRYVEVIIA